MQNKNDSIRLKKVTDPAILAELNSDNPGERSIQLSKVTDPSLLAQLNANEVPDETHYGKRALAGLGQMGHKLLNSPYDLGKGLQEELMAISKPIDEHFNVDKYVKFQETPDVLEKIRFRPDFDYEKAVGLEGEGKLSERVLQGLLRNAPEILGGTKLALDVGKGAINLGKSFTAKNIAESIQKGKAEAKDLYRGKYSDLFKKAKDSGIAEVSKPKIDINTITKNSMPKYHETLLEFAKNPTLENAHWAQSDLGKFVRHMEKVGTNNPLTSSQIKAVKEAQNAQQKIKNAMFAENKLNANSELAKEYGQISGGYATDVVPYSSARALTKFERGELSSSDLISRLNKDHAFMEAFKKQYPKIKLNQLLKNHQGKLAVGTILSALGGYEAGKHL